MTVFVMDRKNASASLSWIIPFTNNNVTQILHPAWSEDLTAVINRANDDNFFLKKSNIGTRDEQTLETRTWYR